MDFLQGNWFAILTVIAYAIGYAIMWGRKEQRSDQLIKKLDGFEGKLDEAVKEFRSHANDGEIHVTSTLLELFRERNDFVKKELSDTRTDVQRIETLLTNMR